MASLTERASSFGAIAADYDRLRPGPAPEAIGWLLPARCEVAVDLAAGTGLLSRVLAARVDRVVAIEPDERMAAVLRARSAGPVAVRAVGEALPLAAGRADAILVSSAWHWLDADRAIPELARVLRSGGRLGVLRTGVDTEIAWVRELIRYRHDNHDGPSGDHLKEMADRYRALPETGSFGDAARASFTFTRQMGSDDLVAMFTTYSAFLTASAAERAGRLASLRSAVDRLFAGSAAIDVPMRTQCWRAVRQPARRR